MIDIEIEDGAWSASLADAVNLTRRAAEAALVQARPEAGGEIVVLLTGDERLRELNARFLGKDKPTNVLSFPAGEVPASPVLGGHLGDIALAFGVCAGEARDQGKPLANHLQHLVCHGVLHLLGYDHEIDADAEVMEDLERVILAGLGIPDPYSTDHTPG